MKDFYSIEGSFFILVGSEEIEVNELVYKKCRSIYNNTKYLDRKYNRWNPSFDDECTASKRSLNIEEDFVFKDEIKGRLKKLNQMDKVIVNINKRKQGIREVT